MNAEGVGTREREGREKKGRRDDGAKRSESVLPTTIYPAHRPAATICSLGIASYDLTHDRREDASAQPQGTRATALHHTRLLKGNE